MSKVFAQAVLDIKAGDPGTWRGAVVQMCLAEIEGQAKPKAEKKSVGERAKSAIKKTAPSDE